MLDEPVRKVPRSVIQGPAPWRCGACARFRRRTGPHSPGRAATGAVGPRSDGGCGWSARSHGPGPLPGHSSDGRKRDCRLIRH